jgi:tryptophan halogenase
MRIAVLGGGTAGFIAAAHLTRYLPQAELLHIFDSRIPIIGVGEGTTPRFTTWFEEITSLGFSHLAEHCGATLKKGSRYEGWGCAGTDFVHRFQPARLIAYHLDAAAIVHVLADHVCATRIDARVDEIRNSSKGVQVLLDDSTEHLCDYVFDARGFPKGNAEDVIRLDWIPTGRATIRRLSPQGLSGVSRIIARPHGWIFQIPLRDWTSCGYVSNPNASSDDEVAADFTAFLHDEGIFTWEQRVAPSFPNFMRRKVFDGRVFWIGNAASFIEPLEATTIGHAIGQIRSATRWISELGQGRCAGDAEIDAFNSATLSYMCCDSLFVAWHYACGSRWDTAFWRHAQRGIERAQQNPLVRAHWPYFEKYVEAGRALPGLALSRCEDQETWDREFFPLLRLYQPFGNFSEFNFAQIGHGIGYYKTVRDVTQSSIVEAGS